MKRSRYILLTGAFVAVMVFCLPLTLLGKGPSLTRVKRYAPDRVVEPSRKSSWTFSADRVVGDHTSEYVEAFGNCTILLGKDQLRADFARYYQNTGWVYLKGNIRAQWGGDFLQAEEGEFDLNNMTGWIKNGKLFMAKPHVYVEAERVSKSQGDSYSFKNARITACEGNVPDWSVASEKGDIELDGTIKLYRSSFRIKDVSVFYWPYMTLPGRQKRGSGFLMPSASISDKLGIQMNLPYFWVINEKSDATFYQNYMTKRGYQQGVEFRHAGDSASKGMWMVDALKDQHRVVAETDEWEDYNGDGLVRPNRSRWWLRSKYNGWLGSPRLQVKLDIDLVSDQNYLRDFEKGPNGFDRTREKFIESFGRDIESKDSLTRSSTFLLARNWDRFGLSGKMQYTQNLAFMNGNGRDKDNTTVQTLPQLEAFAFQQQVPGTPFEVSAETRYDYFTRNKGHTGHRLRVTPELKLPLSSRVVTVTPFVAGDYTAYDIKYDGFGSQTIVNRDSRELVIDSNAVKDGFSNRATWAAGFHAFSEMSQVFSLNGSVKPAPSIVGTSKWMRLKHSIVPRVSYKYTPTLTGQDKFPYFDELDRIDGTNKVTYSLTNVLDRKRETVVLAPGKKKEPQSLVVSDYLDFLFFRLEQSYDYNEANRQDKLARYARRPFSDLLAEIRIRPEDYIDLISRSWFSPYRKGLTQTESAVRFYKDGLGEISVGYDFLMKIDEYKRKRDRTLSVLNLGAKWDMSQTFWVEARYRHDFNRSQDLERTLRLAWLSGCYSLYFTFIQEPNDNRFEFSFDLFNF